MEFDLKTKNITETLLLGEIIARFAFKKEVILLSGDLGAGKTTLTKGIGKGLTINEEINSPTFNILKCYFNKSGNLNLYHIDAYRLEDVNPDNKNIGLEEVLDGDGVSVIERPKFIDEFIDHDEALKIIITIDENNFRNFHFETKNKKFDSLFEYLKKEGI